MFQHLLDKKKKDITIESVRESYQEMYNEGRINDMTKIKLKCWLYHSESRNKNGNPPFLFENYVHALGKETYLDYIKFGLINCDDIGGKEKANEIVMNWFA
ncbi:hypothetical protein CVD28_00950 [Bacillus sp. M6-12]|uniref:hypothetical protein n=1 Tax=Bacillus sp. M6-12 TaxID=2054166 RepID=UPI000C772EC1|nr:hypothetical protein [Bacillus sp. M6-12]PLS19001.1 hypothetical protein CVD28_00950 [Bacillus sp. M6-12]